MSSAYHLLEKVQFSDEATFYVSGAVNCPVVGIWGSDNPHAYVDHQRDSPKVNVFCAISTQKVYGPFFFAEETVTGMTYLDMLQLWLMPQLQNIPTFIFQQDGKSRPLPLEVRQYLNSVTRTLDRACAWKWPTADAMAPEVPWHYAMWFFLWGYVKDRLFVPTLPRDLDGQRARIIATVKNIDAPMLTRVWQELAYRIDVCRAARGAHIEKL